MIEIGIAQNLLNSENSMAYLGFSGIGITGIATPIEVIIGEGSLIAVYDPETRGLTLSVPTPLGPPSWSGTGLSESVSPRNVYLNGGPLSGSYNAETDTLSLTPTPPPSPLDFSGVGITGTVVPTAIILGEGTSGSYNSGTHEFTVTSPPIGASGNGITGTVKPVEVILSTGLSGSWNAGNSKLTMTLATPLGALVLSEEIQTIANDTITISGSTGIVKLETEGGVTSDDLRAVNGGVDNQVIFLRTESNVRDVHVKSYVSGTDNLYLVSAECFCHHNACTIALRKQANKWVELFRNDISAF
jgi:hypothetical protein